MSESKMKLDVLAKLVARAIEIIGEDNLEDYEYCNGYPEYQRSYDAVDNFDPDNLPPIEERSMWEVCQEIEDFGYDYCISKSFSLNRLPKELVGQ